MSGARKPLQGAAALSAVVLATAVFGAAALDAPSAGAAGEQEAQAAAPTPTTPPLEVTNIKMKLSDILVSSAVEITLKLD
jgi:hypothetical protein